jgi:hypothetical protein
MLKMYIVTDELKNTTGAYIRCIDACASARRDLAASTFLKDSRSISLKDENGEYALLGAFQKRAGRIIPSFKVIKHWRDRQNAEGLPCSLNEFWRALDVCPKCHGDKGNFDFDCAAQDWVRVTDCATCKGEGKYVEPKVTKMKLIVKDTVYKSEGAGTRQCDLDLEEGTAERCMKCFRDIKDAYDPEQSQFRIEEDGRIVAIQVHGELLWLANVPPPEYFYPHYKRRQAENADARRLAQEAKDAYTQGLMDGIDADREGKLLAAVAKAAVVLPLAGVS